MQNFYTNKKILVTGHTGFKGSWLSLYLNILGAKVYGISLKPKNKICNFNLSQVKKICKKSLIFDLKNFKKLEQEFKKIEPDVIFHLAAQPLVSVSYDEPSLTWKNNLISTLNLLELTKNYKKKITLIVITSDKCYENLELKRGYKEDDRLGGKDPYSASKASVEILCRSYFESFFKKKKNVKFATVRAGNVIGGGDWSKDRLIPDIIKSIKYKRILEIRNPQSTRPWQHVLEPLSGYILLAQKINLKKNLNGESFNFGPNNDKGYTVHSVVKKIKKIFPKLNFKVTQDKIFHESNLLKLNCNKSKKLLKWKQLMSFAETINFTSEWYKNYFEKKDCKSFTNAQIESYIKLSK
jgi:CDP-glucose 4,6-dehydratase